MQRVTGVVVNDGALLPWFAKSYAGALEVSDAGARGHWGLGFEGNGELLVKRAPLGGRLGPAQVLAEIRARQVVLAAHGDPGPRRSIEDAQPLRYRDWLFAASGTAGLSEAFVARVQAESLLRDFVTTRGVTPDEAVMMVFVDALYRGHARDTRKVGVAVVREAIAAGAARLRELLKPAAPDLAVLLYAHDQLFAVPLGRPMCVARLGASEHLRLERSPDARRVEHLRGVIVGDRQVGNARWQVLESAASIGVDAEVVPFTA